MQADNPRSRRLAGTIAALTLLAACGGDPTGTGTPETGSVVVEATTTGEDLDPDGYVLSAQDKEVTIAANGSATLAGVPRGETIMQIGDVAENCTVAGGTSRVVFPGSPFPVPLDVECLAIEP